MNLISKFQIIFKRVNSFSLKYFGKIVLLFEFWSSWKYNCINSYVIQIHRCKIIIFRSDFHLIKNDSAIVLRNNLMKK